MPQPLPPLLAARAFEAVARCGSVRLAGDELLISHTVVSRHVHNLELSLGVKLTRRAGRGLELTPEGARLAAQLRKAFGIIADARAELCQDAEAALHICCSAAIASHYLLARLPELKARLGGRDVLLQPNNNRPNLSRDPVDAEIIFLRAPPPVGDMRAELVSRPRIIPVASAAFKALHPHVHTPADLLALPLIHEQSTRLWETWLAQAGIADPPRLSGLQLWHGQMTLEAARLGQGVALVSELIAAESIAAGDLVEIVPTYLFMGGFYLVAPARRWDTPALRCLRAWLWEVFPVPANAGASGAR